MQKLSKLLICLMGMSLVLCFAPNQMQAQDKTTSVKGEIVDMNCYMTKGAKGADHASCAKSCLKGGAPMGLLTDDGTLVLLSKDNKKAEAFDALKEKAGEKVSVSGSLAERNGVKMLTVSGSGGD